MDSPIPRQDLQTAQAFITKYKEILSRTLKNARGYSLATPEAWLNKITAPADIGERFCARAEDYIKHFVNILADCEKMARRDLHRELAIEFNTLASNSGASITAIKIALLKVVYSDLAQRLPLSGQLNTDDIPIGTDETLSPEQLKDFVSSKTLSLTVLIEKPGPFVGKNGANIKSWTQQYAVSINMIGSRGAPRSCAIKANSKKAILLLLNDTHFQALATWPKGLGAKTSSDKGPFKWFPLTSEEEISKAADELCKD